VAGLLLLLSGVELMLLLDCGWLLWWLLRLLLLCCGWVLWWHLLLLLLLPVLLPPWEQLRLLPPATHITCRPTHTTCSRVWLKPRLL
jgi:hypothetical protein